MMDGATHLVTVELVVSGQVLGPETEVVSLEVRRAHDRPAAVGGRQDDRRQQGCV